MADARRERSDSAQKTMVTRLLREPTLHFFMLAALLLVGQKLAIGEPLTPWSPPLPRLPWRTA